MKLILIIKKWLKVLVLNVALRRTLFRLTYYNPEAGCCRINILKRKTGLSKKVIEELSLKQDVYTRFKPVIRKFKRRRVYVPKSNNKFDADLLFIKKYSKHNNNINYLLIVKDSFSRYAWIYSIKRKTATLVIEGFKNVFKDKKLIYILSDKGSEFTSSSKLTQQLFKDINMQW